MIEVFITLLTLIAISGIGCIWFLFGFEKGSGISLKNMINPLLLITVICWVLGILCVIIFSDVLSYITNNASYILFDNIIFLIITIIIFGLGFITGFAYDYMR